MKSIGREAKISAAFVSLADTLVEDFDVVDLLNVLVDQCAEILDVEAGGLMLVDANHELQLIASTSEDTGLVEVMQLAAGAGPCVECFHTGSAVSVADISLVASKWPAFSAEALKRGFQSVHATPMRLRSQIIGTLNLFGTATGELNDADIAVAQALADVATIAVLQEQSARESHVIAGQLQHALNSRIVIEQAKGVLSQTENMTMEEAFNALRAHARSNNLSLNLVAKGVVDRRLQIGSRTRK